MKRWRIFGRVAAVMFALLSVPAFAASHPKKADAVSGGPKPRHVFIIVLENEGYDVTFGAKSPAAYLKALAQQGALLPNYYGIGHYSLDNYIALVSGQAPNPVTQADCQSFVISPPPAPPRTVRRSARVASIRPAYPPSPISSRTSD